MNVRHYLQVFRKRWLTILVVTLLGVAAAAAFVLTSTKIYTASARLFVAASSASGTAALNNGQSFAQARVQSYTDVVTNPDVMNAVVKRFPDLKITATQLASKVSADAPLNKVVLNIHVDDTSAVDAARLTNALASQLVTYIENIERTSADLSESPVKLTIVHPASVPSSPTSPRATLDLLIGTLAGLLLGIAVGGLRESLDTRIRTIEDVTDASDAAVIAVVPTDRRTTAEPIAPRGDEYSPRAESYRQLRANLGYVRVDAPPRVIAVTSAVSGEGKSTTAANLAFTLADAGQSVFLLDADLRRPTVAKYLGVSPGAGLTSILAGRASIEDVAQPVGSNLSVIASGPTPPNPSELLASLQFRELLATLSERAQYVIIDSTPLLPVADGREVARAADISLLVVQATRTNRAELRTAVDALHKVGASLGGIVFNMVAARNAGAYYNAYAPEKERPRRLAGA